MLLAVDASVALLLFAAVVVAVVDDATAGLC